MRYFPLALLAVMAVSACGIQSTQMPNSTTGADTSGPASKAPEASNSLPNGAQTDAALTPSFGDVNSTRVGPATVVRRPGAAVSR